MIHRDGQGNVIDHGHEFIRSDWRGRSSGSTPGRDEDGYEGGDGEATAGVRHDRGSYLAPPPPPAGPGGRGRSGKAKRRTRTPTTAGAGHPSPPPGPPPRP